MGIVLTSLLVLVFSGTIGSRFLSALIYPIEIEETEKRGGNFLVVRSFVDGLEEPGAVIGQQSGIGNLNSFPTSGAGGATPYEIRGEDLPLHEKWPEMKNIVLQAPPSHGGGYFVGWSGCDVTDKEKKENWSEPEPPNSRGRRCQVSVTDNQIRKIEAHYMTPNEELPLQIFSISENMIDGELPDSWIDVEPELVYKASYLDLEGEIPGNIGNLSVANSLQLNLGYNTEMEGPIPDDTDNLGSIDYLGLYAMGLEGEIPEDLGSSLSPIYFLAYQNVLGQDSGLDDDIPESLGEMGSRPARFELHENELKGEVPYELHKLSGLEPPELRLYDNRLEETEDDLILDSNWEGVNFNTNDFSTSDAMDTLEDAARRDGTYIDFCNNPADGGRVRYDLEGGCVSTDIHDEVNEAVEAGWDVYIRIELEQWYDWYDGCSSANCSRSYDEGGECESASPSGCTVLNPSGYKQYCHGDAMCVRIEDPIESCDDITPNSEGLPEEVIHASRCPGCEYYTHPECEPECIMHGVCTCTTDTLWCETTYPYSGRDEKGRTSENPFRSTDCAQVQRLYNPYPFSPTPEADKCSL